MSFVNKSTLSSQNTDTSLLYEAFPDLQISESNREQSRNQGFLSSLREREHNANWRGDECQSLLLQNAYLMQEFPRLKNIFDEAAWIRLFGEEALTVQGLVFNEPVLDAQERRSNLAVINSYKIEKNITTEGLEEEDPGISELTLPKNLSFNKFKALVEGLPARNDQARLKYNQNDSLRRQWDICIEETSRVAIANAILLGSRYMTVDQQLELPRVIIRHQLTEMNGEAPSTELVKKMSGEMPDLLSASALAILTYMSSSPKAPIRLFPHDDLHQDDHRLRTFTRCKDQGIVGDFSPTLGLYVRSNPATHHQYLGIGVMRKLNSNSH